MNELIEKLKDKKQAQPYGLLSDDERDVLETAGKNNCYIYCEGGGWEISHRVSFSYCYAYILKPDYEPEPEYIEIEIEVDGQGMYVLKEGISGCEYKMLWWAETHKDFVCFHDPFGKETTNAGDVPGWMRTLAAQDGDIKMHARFVKP